MPTENFVLEHGQESVVERADRPSRHGGSRPCSRGRVRDLGRPQLAACSLSIACQHFV